MIYKRKINLIVSGRVESLKRGLDIGIRFFINFHRVIFGWKKKLQMVNDRAIFLVIAGLHGSVSYLNVEELLGKLAED